MNKIFLKKSFSTIILIALISITNAQWNNDPAINNLSCDNDASKFDLAAIPDGSGGLFMVWQDQRNSSIYAGEGTDADIYAQHIDENGNALWEMEGIPVIIEDYDQVDPEIISDGENGFYVIWFDARNGTEYIDSIDFFMQHIDFDGNLLWDIKGLQVSAVKFSTPNDIDKEIISDGAGGAIIAYYGNSHEVATDEIIYASRINSAGEFLWNGIIINDISNDISGLSMVADAEGGAFITWDDHSTSDVNIAVQHIDANGSFLLAEDGILITSLIDENFNAPVAAFDNDGGVYIAWADWRNNFTQIHAQHIDENGNILWVENGISVTTSAEFQSDYQIDAASDGGALISWEQGYPLEVFAQKINNAGTILWGEDALKVFESVDDTEQDNLIRSDGYGGAVISANEISFPSKTKTRNVKPDGTFNGDQVLVATGPGSKFSTNFSATIGNSWIFSWIEDKVEDQNRVYASKIEFVPYATTEIEFNTSALKNLLHIYPNPATEFIIVDVQINGSETSESICQILDMHGAVITEKIVSLQNQIQLPVHHLPDGLYNIKIISDSNIKTSIFQKIK